DAQGIYDLSLRVASDNASGGPFTILINGEERMAPVPVSGTGGWDQFVTIHPGSMVLDISDTLMRVNFNTGGFNLGRMTFQYNTTHSTQRVQNGPALSIYPNPAGHLLHILISHPEYTYQIIGLNGSVILKGESTQPLEEIDISSLGAGIYQVISRNPGGTMQRGSFIKLPQ
ncbi:MAG: T9SS type A sorting domain-containing protein, partial [Bacteroidales bacterium]|nr:T9SS type A sorting domain-containing protein [Bacteroidales bacterium]